jgi:hypothetical protein
MKKIIFALLFAACFVSVSFAQTDQITLTTYYPAPFGMYQEMRVMGKLGVGTTDPTDAVEIVGGTSVTPEVVSIKNSGGGQALLKFDSPTKAASTNIGMVFDVHGGQTGTLQYNQMYGFGIMGGNVGIGTSTSPSNLTVDDGSGAYAPVGSDPVGVFMTGTKNKPALSVVSTNASGATTPSAGNVALYAYGTDYAGYFSNGKTYFANNVGIGTSTPGIPLLVEGSGSTAAFISDGTTINSYALSLAQNVGSTKGAPPGRGGLYIANPDAGTYGIYQASSPAYNYFNGKVGIGSSIPICDLYVKNTDFSYAATIENSPGTNGPTVQIFNDMSPASYNIKTGILLAGASDSYGVYQASGGENYFSGNVGVNVTNPTAHVDIDGELRLREQSSLYSNGSCHSAMEGKIIYGSFSSAWLSTSYANHFGGCMCNTSTCSWVPLYNP